MTPEPALLAPRVTGRRLAAADWPLIHAIHTAPEAGRWLRAPGASESRSRNITRRLAAAWEAHDFGPWLLRAEGAEIGYAGLRVSARLGTPVIEALWGLLPDAWGRGLAAEAVRAAIDAEAERGFDALTAWTLPDNLRSRALMARLGFIYVRELVYADLPHVLYRKPLP